MKGTDMEYEITIERTQRFRYTFKADNDEAAKQQAGKLFCEEVEAHETISTGEVSWDYAVMDEVGRTIIDWS